VLEDDIFAALAGDVGGSTTSTSSEDWPTAAQDRVYPVLAPSAAPLPRITFQRVTTQADQTLEHPPAGFLDLVRVQVDCWAGSPERAIALAMQARRAMGAAAFKGRLKSRFSVYEPQSGVYRESADYHCWERSS
jgi:hypothetical protein